MEQITHLHSPRWAKPLALLAGAGVAGILISLSIESDESGLALPGLTYEMEHPTSSEPMALIVTSVQRDSAADSADIATGDIIDQVDGHKISSEEDVSAAIAEHTRLPISVRLRRGGIWLDKRLPAPLTRGNIG